MHSVALIVKRLVLSQSTTMELLVGTETGIVEYNFVVTSIEEDGLVEEVGTETDTKGCDELGRLDGREIGFHIGAEAENGDIDGIDTGVEE